MPQKKKVTSWNTSPVEKLYGLVENGKSMVELQEIDGRDFWDCMLEFGPVLEYILSA